LRRISLKGFPSKKLPSMKLPSMKLPTMKLPTKKNITIKFLYTTEENVENKMLLTQK